MNRSILTKLGAFAAAATFFGLAATSAFAQAATGTTATTPPVPQKHDSNSLHKFGKAIEYPFRKGGENLANDTHKTTHSKSVVRNRTTGNNFVEKPNGHTIFKSTTNPAVPHHMRHHHYRHHHHHMMMKKK